MEFDNAADPFSTRGKECGSEVKSSLFLAETASRNDANTGGIEQLHAVEGVGCATIGSSSFDSLLGEMDGREEVHGTLGLVALNAFHLGESLVQSSGTLLEAVEDVVVLLVVQLEGGLSSSGRVDHELDEALANDRGTEHDGHELVDVGLYFSIEANKFKVTTTVTTLADHALGDTVHRHKFDLVVLPGVLLLQLAQNALEAVELSNEDVGLVHFVSHENEVFLAGEVNDATDILLRQRSTSRVTGVDDNNAADIDAIGLGLVV